MAWEDRTPAEKAAADAAAAASAAIDDDVVYVVTAGDGRSRYTVAGIVSARIVARSVDGTIAARAGTPVPAGAVR